MAIIFGGIFGGLALLLSRLGGFGGLRSSLPGEYMAFPLSSQFDLKQLISLLILVGLTYVVGPDMYTRLFCARNESVARTSTFWAALLIIPFALCITTMGMGARALYPDILPEQAFPTVMKEVLPPALNGIVLAALLCAVMSSADTCLLSASTILTVDVVGHFSPQVSERRTLLLSRWGVMILGACSLILALILKGVISALLFAYTVYTCGLILPVVAGFYRKKLRVNSYGALAAIIGGGAIALAGKLSGVECLNLGGFAIGGLLLFLVSFLTRKKEPLP
jgi:SSS family solute:Na+ symporter